MEEIELEERKSSSSSGSKKMILVFFMATTPVTTTKAIAGVVEICNNNSKCNDTTLYVAYFHKLCSCDMKMIDMLRSRGTACR